MRSGYCGECRNSEIIQTGEQFRLVITPCTCYDSIFEEDDSPTEVSSLCQCEEL